jgi:hypothetical protein
VIPDGHRFFNDIHGGQKMLEMPEIGGTISQQL